MAHPPTPPPPPAPRSGRRDFLTATLSAATSAGLLAGGVGLASYSQARPAQALRPPGARIEKDFLAACTRCGLCVRACPYGTLKLGRWGDGVGPGTPFFTARETACEMCPDIPCIPPCPTGALDHQLTDIQRARMGLAVVVDQESCLNFLGLRCDVCYRVCPVIDQAITLEKFHNPRSDRHALFLPTVHSAHCTGCGKCEQACVLEEAAIKVLPFSLARGKLGSHYRKGWEEKEKAGRALLEGLDTPQVRQPPSSEGPGVDNLREGFK